MIPALIVLLLLVGLYLFCLIGRRNHRILPKLRGWKYAHRGLHNGQRPENSMAAFRAALEKGYGVELDIHLLKDGSLAVFHDGTLKRMAGEDIKIENLTAADLAQYPLAGTQETIPLFEDVLALFDGKIPTVVELKCVDGNHAALCQAALQRLDPYKGDFCMESFDPRAVHWLRKNRPDICRGQLAENWFRSDLKLPWILKFFLTFHLSNVYTRPDFIAYRYAHRKVFGTAICRRLLGLQGVSWTIQNQQEMDIALQEGWLPIFESFEP